MSGPIPPFLSERFAGRAAAAHGTVWNELWVERLTPWDRGGPSLALLDLLVLLPGAEKEASGVPLFPVTPQTGSAPPSSGSSSRRRPRALVPGCGRGHDVLLLAQLGWDVVGLDYSPTAIEEAKSNAQTGGMDTAARVVFERRMEAGIIRSESDPVPRAGDVTWLAGDFFARGRSASALDKLVEDEMGGEGFDLIFDYTFLCALPLDLRPSWSSRVTSLLARPHGRLICLEFPSDRNPREAGPPWAVPPELYVALLARPGEEVTYDKETGKVASVDGRGDEGMGKGLKRLVHIKPARTHKAGYDAEGRVSDWISVWAWQQ